MAGRWLSLLCVVLALWGDLRPHRHNPHLGDPDVHRRARPCDACLLGVALPLEGELPTVERPVTAFAVRPPPLAGPARSSRELLRCAPKQDPPSRA